MSSHLALKLGYINKINTHILEVELKSLYFNFVWVLQNRVFSYLSRGNEKLLKSQLGDRSSYSYFPFNRRSVNRAQVTSRASRGKPIVFFQETTIHFIIYGGKH